MLDCPDRLYTGADLLVSLSLHILPSAFKRYKAKVNTNPSTGKISFFDKEGVETDEEKVLRNRKLSLQNLFKKLDLRPREGPSPPVIEVGEDQKENIPPEGTPRPSQIVCSGSRKGLGNGCAHNHQHGHGHDSEEEEDGEVLSDGDLRVIYKRFVHVLFDFAVSLLMRCTRAQAQDASMEEMDPDDSFTFKLRPYQKQALL